MPPLGTATPNLVSRLFAWYSWMFIELLHQTRTARPTVFRAQHRDRNLGRIGIGRNAVIVEMLGSLLDLHVARKRRDDRFLDALGLHLVHHLDDEVGEHHRRRDDGVPVA